MVQGEDKLKGTAKANLEGNRRRFERKKYTGSDLAVSTRELAVNTRPQELILRQDRAVEHGVTTRRSRIFGDRMVCGDGFFVERSHLLTAISVVARAWRYRLHRRHAPGLLLRM